jgi:hypothetical protein
MVRGLISSVFMTVAILTFAVLSPACQTLSSMSPEAIVGAIVGADGVKLAGLALSKVQKTPQAKCKTNYRGVIGSTSAGKKIMTSEGGKAKARAHIKGRK